MPRGGRDARLGLDEIGTAHPEAVLEVRPVLVIAYDIAAAERLRHSEPAPELFDEWPALELLTFEERV